MEEVQGLDDTIRRVGGFGSTRVKGKNDTSEKKEKNENGENEQTGEKESMDKNETLKGRNRNDSGRARAEKKMKTEGSSKLSRKQQIISVK